MTLTVACVLMALCGPWRMRVVNPGPISSQHSGPPFHSAAKGHAGASRDCAPCHRATLAQPGGWVHRAAQSTFQLLTASALFDSAPIPAHGIDQNCLQCHSGHGYHRAAVSASHSCAGCHSEHRGDSGLNRTTDPDCTVCHASEQVMHSAAAKRRRLPDTALAADRPFAGKNPFDRHLASSRTLHVISDFESDHPDFYLHRERLRETNTLKFSHARHFADDIPLVGGARLECRTCHMPDAAGAFHEPPSYTVHCKACHSLQFDSRTPTLALPHGDGAAVRAFLGSLPVQYADFARREHGLTAQRDIDQFIEPKLRALRAESGTERNLERQVFFGGKRLAAEGVGGAGGPRSGVRATFHGCVFCHEVIERGEVVPWVVPPNIPDRWLAPGSFDHAKHGATDCRRCHDVNASRDTTDILLPHQAACVTCHSRGGGVAHQCVDCHRYHSNKK